MALPFFSRNQPKKPVPPPPGAGTGPGFTAPSILDNPYAPPWDNYAPRYRMPAANVPLETVEHVQETNDNFYTHPLSADPTSDYPRWNNSRLLEGRRDEWQHGQGSWPEAQQNAGRAPDPRWSPVPVERPQRTPQQYSFIRPFDVMMGKRNFDGSHFSQADYRQMNQPVFGMQPTRNARNTYRITPPPMDVNIVDLPSYGEIPPVTQAEFTSPVAVQPRSYRLA